MIPVDRDGIECRGFLWCPFLRSVCVCNVYLFVCRLMSHLKIFCIYGGVTIVFKVRIIHSHTRLSSHLSKDEFLSCIFVAFCDHIQMTVTIKSPCINKGYWGPVLTQIIMGLFVVSAKKKYYKDEILTTVMSFMQSKFSQNKQTKHFKRMRT